MKYSDIKYALDTCILSSLIVHNSRILKTRLEMAVEKGHKVIIPPTVYYKFRSFLRRLGDSAQIKAFTDFCLKFSVGEMNIAAWECAAELSASDIYDANKNISSETDCMTAAFCIVNGCTLITDKTSEYSGILMLSLENWLE